VELAARNICGLKVIHVNNLNVKDLLHAEVLLTTESALQTITNRFKSSHKADGGTEIKRSKLEHNQPVAPKEKVKRVMLKPERIAAAPPEKAEKAEKGGKPEKAEKQENKNRNRKKPKSPRNRKKLIRLKRLKSPKSPKLKRLQIRQKRLSPKKRTSQNPRKTSPKNKPNE
jgi:hypothetical protein